MCCEGFFLFGEFGTVEEKTGLEVNRLVFKFLSFPGSDNFSLSFGLSSVKWEERGSPLGMLRR